MRFSLSQNAEISVERPGAEGEPIAVIDNALADPAALVEFSASLNYGRIGPYYPGLRAPLDADFTASMSEAISHLAQAHLDISSSAWSGEVFFSLVTTLPQQLAPIQRLPHYDGVEANRLAALIYLGKAEQGGTSFYRHKSTGFEKVTADRFPGYKQTLEQEVRAHGLPPARYIDDGAPLFERTAKIEAKFNRMLIYRGALLHCSAINNNTVLSSDPRAGRLTITAFLRPAETGAQQQGTIS